MSGAGAFERPRVSRETRRLLAAAACALVALWVLARLRFPEAAGPNPVPPLLAQLAPPARFSELAAEVNAVGARVREALLVVPLQGDDGVRPRLAVRIGPGLAAAIAPAAEPGAPTIAAAAVATDRPSGLMLVATDQPDPVNPPRPSTTRPGPASQYLFAARPMPEGLIDVRPLYVTLWPGSRSPAWGETLWHVSAENLSAGTFLFTAAAELVGVVVRTAGDLTVVPSSAFYAAADGLLTAPEGAGTGWLGAQVTSLTPPLAAATGVGQGVLVVHVTPGSAADGHLAPGDVITRVNDQPVTTGEAWRAIVDRLPAGTDVRLRRESPAGAVEVRITAATAPSAAPARFGARLERVDGRTRVASVERGSSAAEAGLMRGDVITRAGTIADPTPAQITRALATRTDEPLLILFSRDDVAQATAIAR